MSHTITLLLKKIGLDHYVPPESPLLKFPLSCFRDNEHLEIVTFLLLYQHHWLAEINTAPQKKLGQISESYATSYYTRVLSVVRRGFAEMNISASEPAKRTLPGNPSIWLSSEHMVLMLQKKTLFEKFRRVLNYLEPLNVFFKWLKSETLDALEEQQFNRFFVKPYSKEIDAGKIKAFATLIVNYEFLPYGNKVQHIVDKQIIRISDSKVLEVESYGLTSPRGDAQHSICEQIIRINDSKNINSELEIPTKDILHSLFLELSRRFPINLHHLLTLLKIDVPTNLSDWCRSILQIDLRDISKLNESQWPELIYYISLFMYQFADTDFDLAISYSYPETELTARLGQLMQANVKYLSTHIQIDNGQVRLYAPQWSHMLQTELKENKLDLHPQLLGLLCFAKSPALKELFIEHWFLSDRISHIPHNSIALIPSANPFLLGHTYYNAQTKKPVKVHHRDLAVLEQLINLANTYQDSQTQLEFEALRIKTQSPAPFHSASSSNNVSLRSSPLTLFAPQPQKRVITCVSIPALVQQFNFLKYDINDSRLAQSLSFDSLRDYRLQPVINYAAVIEFLHQYAHCDDHQIPAYLLSNFFTLFSDESRINELTDKRDFLDALLHFNEHNSLSRHIERIVHILQQFHDISQASLNSQWTVTRKHMFHKLKIQLEQLHDQFEARESPFVLI